MRKTNSAILETVRETAKGLHAAGVTDQVALREFDRLCLPPVQALPAEEIRKIREKSRGSGSCCGTPEYHCIHAAEAGDRSEAANRDRAQTDLLGAEARLGDRCLGRGPM